MNCQREREAWPAVGYTAGNFRAGNDAEFLKKGVSACVPFIGFQRSLNAIAIIDECSDKTEL